nr:excinuclease ATPase subunit [uncultured Albidiferax sp.]
MKKTIALSAAVLALSAVFTAPAFARDVEYQIPLEEVLKMPEAQAKLDGSVKFYLSGSNTPAIEQTLGEDRSHGTANGSVKEELAGCHAAALSSLLAFQAKAKKLGANAVVDIHSFFKNEVNKSPTTLECHAGTFRIHVVLKASYAKVAAQ